MIGATAPRAKKNSRATDKDLQPAMDRGVGIWNSD